MSAVRIEMTGPSSGEIWVDGVQLEKVVAIRFNVDLRPESESPTQVEVVQKFYPTELDIVGNEVDVTTMGNYGARRHAKTDGQA